MDGADTGVFSAEEARISDHYLQTHLDRRFQEMQVCHVGECIQGIVEAFQPVTQCIPISSPLKLICKATGTRITGKMGAHIGARTLDLGITGPMQYHSVMCPHIILLLPSPVYQHALYW